MINNLEYTLINRLAANISHNIETSLSPAQQEVAKHTWHGSLQVLFCQISASSRFTVRLLQATRDAGSFATIQKKYTKPVLLIIDEWLLLKLSTPEAFNLSIHKRQKIHPRFSVLNSVKANDISRSAVEKVHSLAPSWTKYPMIHTRLTSKV